VVHVVSKRDDEREKDGGGDEHYDDEVAHSVALRPNRTCLQLDQEIRSV
jgi:hypothetical protein